MTFQKYKKLLGIVSIVTWEIIQIKTTNYRKYIFRFDLNLFIHFVFLPSLHVCTLVNISVKKLRTRICEDDKVLANHFPTIFLLLYANLLKLIYLFYWISVFFYSMNNTFLYMVLTIIIGCYNIIVIIRVYKIPKIV